MTTPPGPTDPIASERAARRVARRRRRRWIAVAIGLVVVLAAGGAGALYSSLSDDETSRASSSRVPATTASSTTSTTLAEPTLPCRAPLTPDDPLRLWIAGDSIAYTVGTGLGRLAAGTGIVAPVYESRVGSGLASPGLFDWSRRATQELARLSPEVVVFVMGTNDWSVPRSTPLDSTGAPAWKADYASRVTTMVDTLAAEGRTLYWVGPPVLRDPKQEAGATQVATVIAEVVERHPAAEYVDAHDLLDTDDGEYTPTVEVAGRRVQVRSGDGVHFTDAGAEYLGDVLFAVLDRQCRLTAQAVAGRRQPLVETEGSTSVPAVTTTTAPVATTAPTLPETTPPTEPAPTTAPATTPTTTPTTTPGTTPTTAG